MYSCTRPLFQIFGTNAEVKDSSITTSLAFDPYLLPSPSFGIVPTVDRSHRRPTFSTMRSGLGFFPLDLKDGSSYLSFHLLSDGSLHQNIISSIDQYESSSNRLMNVTLEERVKWTERVQKLKDNWENGNIFFRPEGKTGTKSFAMNLSDLEQGM
jgi:hypothetical protein